MFRGKRAKINKAARHVLLPLASSPTSDDATCIGSPQRHDIVSHTSFPAVVYSHTKMISLLYCFSQLFSLFTF